MNAGLKPLLDEVFDVEKGVEDGVQKNWTAMAADGLKAVMDAPSLVQNFSQIKSDCVALVSDPAASQDLVAYLGTKVASKSPELAAVIVASVDGVVTSVQKGFAIYKAVKAYQASLVAAVAAPAAPAPAAPSV